VKNIRIAATPNPLALALLVLEMIAKEKWLRSPAEKEKSFLGVAVTLIVITHRGTNQFFNLVKLVKTITLKNE
jgi:hypothetical protein